MTGYVTNTVKFAAGGFDGSTLKFAWICWAGGGARCETGAVRGRGARRAWCEGAGSERRTATAGAMLAVSRQLVCEVSWMGHV